MPVTIIKNLSDFDRKETFVRLFDRACRLDELISSAHNLRSLSVAIWNELAAQRVDMMDLMREKYELFSIYYRSMFQASIWECSRSGHIDPSAYHFNENHLTQHKKVIEHVDKTIAHQDINDDGRRYVYHDINDEQGNLFQLVSNNINYHIHELEPNVIAIKNAIKASFNGKFHYELKMLARAG